MPAAFCSSATVIMYNLKTVNFTYRTISPVNTFSYCFLIECKALRCRTDNICIKHRSSSTRCCKSPVPAQECRCVVRRRRNTTADCSTHRSNACRRNRRAERLNTSKSLSGIRTSKRRSSIRQSKHLRRSSRSSKLNEVTTGSQCCQGGIKRLHRCPIRCSSQPTLCVNRQTGVGVACGSNRCVC